MKIVIMGAGAMGGLFGGLLALSGEEIWLVSPQKDHIDTILANGVTIEERGRILTVQVKATTDPSSSGKADLVLFFVKTYQTEMAVSNALTLEKEDTVFLTLQNGLGNEEVICRHVDPKKVMVGVTNQGATLIGPGHVRHAGWGETYIGELKGGETGRGSRIAKMFQKAGIKTYVSPKIYELIWAKLLVNVGINALTALTGLKNGQLIDHPETLRIMYELVSEAAEIAKRKGIRVDENPIQKVISVAEATRENRSSMGQDFDHKRKTEIEAINGAIVKEAKSLGISVPYNQMITDLIKVIEKRF
jgi:2-dehydropantoate 2-reductase